MIESINEQEMDVQSFIGNKYYTRSLYSAVEPLSTQRAEVQVVRHNSLHMEISCENYVLEIQLIPFSKRLYVRINRKMMMDLYNFSKLETVQETMNGKSVILAFENGICSCCYFDKQQQQQQQQQRTDENEFDLSRKDNYDRLKINDHCTKHLIIPKCNMDIFAQALSELGTHLDEHCKALQQETDRIIEMYDTHKRTRQHPPAQQSHHNRRQLQPHIASETIANQQNNLPVEQVELEADERMVSNGGVRTSFLWKKKNKDKHVKSS
jgi:hypothetical protein